jgi:hypothetical protein
VPLWVRVPLRDQLVAEIETVPSEPTVPVPDGRALMEMVAVAVPVEVTVRVTPTGTWVPAVEL